MGLDICLLSDNYDDLCELESFETVEDSFNLSRHFCNLMSRKNVIESGIPELEQIAAITNCDITFLYQMENYTSEWELEELMEYEDDTTIESIKEANEKVNNNIEVVISGLNYLISKLNNIDHLEEKIAKTDYDTIGIQYYFSDFKTNKGDGYLNNNFGQDLRNLLNFAEFAKSNNSKTLFFEYE